MSGHYQVVTTSMCDCLHLTNRSTRYINSHHHQGQLSLPSLWGR